MSTYDPLSHLRSKLDGVKGGNHQFMARCPGHDDRNASLSVSVGEGGRALVKCFAGCSLDQILAPLSIEKRELFADLTTSATPPKIRNTKTIHASPEKAAAAITWVLNERNDGADTYKCTAQYEYQDATGDAVGKVLRFESSCGPKQFGQIRPQGDGWITSGPKSPPLYRLSDVLNATAESFIYVVEGEKDADRLKADGLIATTTIGGASKSKVNPKWSRTDLSVLAGRHVVLLPDNDEAGNPHMETMADHLVTLGAVVRLLRLPDLPPKGDASDYLDVGHDAEDIMRLAEGTPGHELAPDEPRGFIGDADDAGTMIPKHPLTELGNAERLVDCCGDRLRFNTSSGKWQLWDGRRWVNDDSGAHVRFAKQTVRHIYGEAVHERKDAAKAAVVAWAKKSEKAAAITAMIRLASTEPGIPVAAEQQDADPWLLNCPNGKLMLKGNTTLLPHDPADNCTAITNAAYYADATCLRWTQFLDRVMDGDEDRIGYLQRLVGYCLTGTIGAQVFPALYGAGANGKSVFADLLLWLLGDYAGIAPDSLLTVSSHQEHPTEIAGLRGKRLVVATETEEGKKLRIGLVKKMTGESQLTARFMRQDFFTFTRTHKTWLVTNHKPTVSESKDAIWRRMHLIPFDVTIPEDERDEQLLDKLKTEASGILAWAVRGCLAWQRDGLKPPDAVVQATQDYRDESDVLSDFLNDVAIVNGDPDNTVSRKSISTEYVAWCKSVGENHPVSRSGLYERLLEHEQIAEHRLGTGNKRERGFKGIALHHAPAA